MRASFAALALMLAPVVGVTCFGCSPSDEPEVLAEHAFVEALFQAVLEGDELSYEHKLPRRDREALQLDRAQMDEILSVEIGDVFFGDREWTVVFKNGNVASVDLVGNGEVLRIGAYHFLESPK